MAGVLDFFSPESGQKRRAALDQLGRSAEYYVPPELRQLLGFAAEMTPTATIDRAAAAGGRMLAPDRTPMQRVGDLGGMLSETAGVAAPMAVAGRAGMPVAQAVQEGLLGFSMGADDVGRKFVERMNQPGPVPTMYSNPLGGAKPKSITAYHGGTGSVADAAGNRGAWFSEAKDLADEYAFGGGSVNQFSISPQRPIEFLHAEQRRPIGDLISTAVESAGDLSDETIAAARGKISALQNRYGDEKRPLFEYWNNDPDIADLFRTLGYDSISVAEKSGGPQTWAALTPDIISPSTISRSLNPAEQMAKDILDLRSAGRAGLDQMRDAARLRREARAQMLEDLTQDASPVRMKSGDLSVLVSKSPDRDGWRVTYFQPDGSPSGHVDTKDKSGAVQRALEDQFTPVSPPTSPARALNPAEQMAKDVLAMRAAGRAGDVTDEMMAQADPQYMFFNTPLPMDEASRMARAQGMGFGGDAYHGTQSDFVSASGDFYTTPDTNYANIYSGSEYDSGGRVLPLMQREGGVLDTRKPDGASVFDDSFYMKYGNASPLTEKGVPDWVEGPDFGEMFQDQGLNYSGVFLDEGKVPLSDGQLLDRGVSTLHFDPTNIRSRFARFDPEFRHLRNLSAGVGGLGLLSTMLPQEEQY